MRGEITKITINPQKVDKDGIRRDDPFALINLKMPLVNGEHHKQLAKLSELIEEAEVDFEISTKQLRLPDPVEMKKRKPKTI